MQQENFGKVMLSELQCLPSLRFFQNWNRSSGCCFEQFENYQKGGYRNRYRILTAQGSLELVIPIQGGRGVKTLVKDVLVDEKLSWRENHWQTLETAYRSSPYYEYLAPELKEILFSPNHKLWEINMNWMHWCQKVLRTNWLIQCTDEYFSELDYAFWDARNEYKNHLHTEELSILHYLFHYGPETIFLL
jgi:hypothetical protein